LSQITPAMSREEVAALVCQTLSDGGVSVVLSGGSVVSIYSNNEFESFDLDFIRTGLPQKVDGALKGLGFSKDGRHWKHPNTRFWVEFPAGPVAIGDTVIRDFAERKTPFGVLRLLGPTECVMDRLAWYFHNGDLECLEQAVAVASQNPIDLERVADWAKRERRSRQFDAIAERLRPK
jgi:hypothetical protein